MQKDSNISKANFNDIPELLSLVNGAYRGDYAKKGWTTEADLIDGIRTDAEALSETISKPGAVILKYTNNENKLMGCVYLQQQGTSIYLGMLTVDPKTQGKGIGKILLSASESFAKEHHFSVIIMRVISIRKELIDWYVRHGYSATNKTEPFPTDNRFGIPKQPLEFILLEKII